MGSTSARREKITKRSGRRKVNAKTYKVDGDSYVNAKRYERVGEEN